MRPFISGVQEISKTEMCEFTACLFDNLAIRQPTKLSRIRVGCNPRAIEEWFPSRVGYCVVEAINQVGEIDHGDFRSKHNLSQVVSHLFVLDSQPKCGCDGRMHGHVCPS